MNCLQDPCRSIITSRPITPIFFYMCWHDFCGITIRRTSTNTGSNCDDLSPFGIDFATLLKVAAVATIDLVAMRNSFSEVEDR